MVKANGYLVRLNTPSMNPTLRNSLAVLSGLVIGGAVNMALVVIGGKAMPPPPGVDVNDIASINAHIGEYSVAQLMAPFLAHALGTLVGALVAARIAVSHHMLLAMLIGIAFLAGGIMAVRMIPNSPAWFSALDLAVAYLPMAWLGARVGRKRT